MLIAIFSTANVIKNCLLFILLLHLICIREGRNLRKFCAISRPNRGALLIILKPLYASVVGKMLYFEVRELGFESLAVRTGCNRTYHKRTIVLHPEGTHHLILFVIKTVKELNRIKTAYCL